MTLPANLVSSLFIKQKAVLLLAPYIGKQVSSSNSLNYPAGTQIGDIVLVEIVATSGTPVVGDDFIAIGSPYVWASYGYVQRMYYKVITSLTPIPLSGMGLGNAFATVYRGPTKIGAINAYTEGQGSTLTLPALTTTANNSVVIAVSVDRDPGTVPAGVTGWQYRGYSNGQYLTCAVSDTVYPTAGTSTGTVQVPQVLNPNFASVGRLIELTY